MAFFRTLIPILNIAFFRTLTSILPMAFFRLLIAPLRLHPIHSLFYICILLQLPKIHVLLKLLRNYHLLRLPCCCFMFKLPCCRFMFKLAVPVILQHIMKRCLLFYNTLIYKIGKLNCLFILMIQVLQQIPHKCFKLLAYVCLVPRYIAIAHLFQVMICKDKFRLQ